MFEIGLSLERPWLVVIQQPKRDLYLTQPDYPYGLEYDYNIIICPESEKLTRLLGSFFLIFTYI